MYENMYYSMLLTHKHEYGFVVNYLAQTSFSDDHILMLHQERFSLKEKLFRRTKYFYSYI